MKKKKTNKIINEVNESKTCFQKKKITKKINIHSNREVNNDKIKCENMID